MGSQIVVVVGVVVTAVVVVWFFVTAKRLEAISASRWDDGPQTPSEQFYGPHPFAPAGPDAESQRPEDTGSAWDPPPPPRRRGRREHGRERRRAPHSA